MPVYNSFISSPLMSGRGLRLGGHHGSKSRTMTAIVDVEKGEVSSVKPRIRQPSIYELPKHHRHSKHTTTGESSVSMVIESPPLVCYGPPKESTGCLLSGLMYLNVNLPTEEFASFKLSLEQTITYKQPVVHSCSDCRASTTVLNTWDLISTPTILPAGAHSYPYSYLFPGSTPASCDNSLFQITYTLRAVATTASEHHIHFSQPITVKRAILPTQDKHSIRIFPPTNLSAALTHPSVVHPGGSFPFTLRIDGVLNRPKNTRWRLRKTSYRIEEHTKTTSIPCSRHAAKIGGDDKGVAHQDFRNVGSGEMKRGWKSDFDTADGKIELEAMVEIPLHANAVCRTDASSGIEVRHILVVECIVAEEYMATAHSRGATPTGAARVLRMQFALCVTAHSGLGISWDEEAPPMYEDIPQAPPGYESPPEYETQRPLSFSTESIESLSLD